MNKSNLLWLFSLAMVLMLNLTFTSCGDESEEDSAPSYTESQFYGSWKCTKLEGTEDPTMTMLNGSVFTFSKEFKDGSNGTVGIPMEVMGVMDMGFEWSLKDNKLTLDILTYKVVFSILEYSNDEVKLSAEVDNNGVVSKMNATINRVK